MARPREKNISKWGYWKRQQRAQPKGGKCSRCGKKVSGRLDTQHNDGNPSNNSKGNHSKLCRSCHVTIDNRKGRHKKGSR